MTPAAWLAVAFLALCLTPAIVIFGAAEWARRYHRRQATEQRLRATFCATCNPPPEPAWLRELDPGRGACRDAPAGTIEGDAA